MREDLLDAARRTDEELPPFPTIGLLRPRAEAVAEALERRVRIGDQTFSVHPAQWDRTRAEAGTEALARALLPLDPVLHLAAAYAENRDERLAEAARDYVRAWQSLFPDAGGPFRGETTLQFAGRLGDQRRPGLTRALGHLAASPAWDEPLLARLVNDLALQTERLLQRMPDSINWRIACADSVLVTALRLRFWPAASEWARQATAILNDAYHRQFHADGSHYEHTPNYHTWMTYIMTGLWTLGRNRPDLELVMEADAVARMWDYALSCTRPNGSFNGLHDCRTRNQGPYGMGHDAFPVAADRRAFRRAAGLPERDPPPSRLFPDAGQALCRTDWSEDAMAVTFDATRDGGGHCHLSRNSVQIYAFRRGLLVDPAVSSYDFKQPVNRYVRSTPAHSTCSLDGLNQAPIDPMNVRFYSAAGYDFCAADYTGGYWAGEYGYGFSTLADGRMANHGRMLFWVQDRAVIVFDSMARTPGDDPETRPPRLECYWSFAPGARVEIAEQGARFVARYPEGGLLGFRPDGPADFKTSVAEGEREPPRGWVCENGVHQPAPQIRWSLDPMRARALEWTTVFIPFAGGEPPAVTARFERAAVDRVCRLWLEDPTGRRDEFLWSYRALRMLGRRGEFETDAGLVHFQRDREGRIRRAAAVGGTYLAPFLPDRLPAPALRVWTERLGGRDS